METSFVSRGFVSFCVIVFLSHFFLVGAIPIPATYDGFTNPPRPNHEPVLLEGFIDPLCIDCKTAWPTIAKVVAAYGPRLSFVVHPFPVPFHHNAFFAARALHIAASLNSSSVFPLLELIFKNQASFLNDATNEESPASVVSRFVDLAVEIGLPSDKFARGYTQSNTDQATRISFKYGCARYVTSTPSFLVNGVPVTADETWTFEEWEELLDPLTYSVSVETTSESHLSLF
ncbi:hypothetical protein R1sor_020341 [Riccia sorocarpa]|uniref:Thioredoxin-like fold domain-containing protein n=1 Tax=Riccia sorocarpa TaxID=122646 RepID=A0ABD3ILE2_9MARC